MKILDIKDCDREAFNFEMHDCINKTLETGSYCEPLYHKYALKVTATCEDNNDFLLRVFREAYLNISGTTFTGSPLEMDREDTTFWFKTTLMDVINFIYEATPPLLQNKIKESITSIENIIELLKTYLIEDNGDKELRVGIFLRLNGLFDYGGVWNDNNGKTQTIRSIVDKPNYHPPIAYIDIDDTDFVQYVLSVPLKNLRDIDVLLTPLNISSVVVTKSSISEPSIVNIKGYSLFGTYESLDLVCRETIDLCEKALNNEGR